MGAQRRTPVACEVPPALAQVAEKDGLAPEEVRMLAALRPPGGRPRTARRWRFIYEAIVGSAALDALGRRRGRR